MKSDVQDLIDAMKAASPKPRSQQLLEEAAVAIKDEVLDAVEVLIKAAASSVDARMRELGVDAFARVCVMNRLRVLLTNVEGL